MIRRHTPRRALRNRQPGPVAGEAAPYSPVNSLPDIDDYWLSTLGVADTGGSVDSWESQILGHVASGTGVTRPVIATGANGIQTIRFDGSDDKLGKTSGWDVVPNTETVVYTAQVVLVNANTGHDYKGEFNDAANASQMWDSHTDNADTRHFIQAEAGTLSTTGEPAHGTVWSIEHWTTGGTHYAQINGGTEASETWVLAAFTASSQIYFGNRRQGGRAGQVDWYEYNIQVGSIPSVAQRSAWRTATYARYGHSGS